jgi:hypothetical protein
MPGYIRRKIGIVVTASRPYPFPDVSGAQSADAGRVGIRRALPGDDLWPQAADETTVHVAVLESYLEKAP